MRRFACIAFILLALNPLLLCGCSLIHNSEPVSYDYEENDGHLHVYLHDLRDDAYICEKCGKEYDGDPDNLVESNEVDTSSPNTEWNRSESNSSPHSGGGAHRALPTYDDPRWPTTSPDLLSIPESDRWYNAWAKAGTWCTVAGPVVGVTHSSDSAGKPVFVNIGSAYPATDSVQLVIWTEGDWSAFSPMLTDVDQIPNCWLSVTGYLQVYNGYLQFNSADGCEFTWWTNVS